MITRVASLTALILKDYPGRGHYRERGPAPSSLLLRWIIPASLSVISLEHHLCMSFLGYYLAGEQVLQLTRPIFHSPGWGIRSPIDK